ncbi:MarR family winged helix-turn-helix transcriptional regulator [Sphingomonas crusticola]|uniref:MarR family winged helix-turn-helix transcriptional regulator n=1 Tax=Sphingomonas crusticola TaxID=1697973 RepID=UPI0013C3271E|nr:MarR family transcriptional regulator [Sphingomonas crusticola]
MTDSAPPENVHALAAELRQVVLTLYRQLRWQTQGLGMAAQDPIIMETIRLAPGIGVTELAQREHMRTPTMTGHINRLQHQGFVERHQDSPLDRRRFGLYLTSAGIRALARVRKRRTDWVANSLTKTSATERAVIAQAIEILKTLRSEDVVENDISLPSNAVGP